MYIKLGIMYATAEGTFSRDKTRAVILTQSELLTYIINNPHIVKLMSSTLFNIRNVEW